MRGDVGVWAGRMSTVPMCACTHTRQLLADGDFFGLDIFLHA